MQLEVVLFAVVILVGVRFVTPFFVFTKSHPSIYWQIAVDITITLICSLILTIARFDEFYKGEPQTERYETVIYVYLVVHFAAIIISHSLTTGIFPALIVGAALYYYPSISILHDFIIPFLAYSGIMQSFVRIICSVIPKIQLVMKLTWLLEIVGFLVTFYLYFSNLPTSEITVTTERAICLGLIPLLYDGYFDQKETFLLNRRNTKPMIQVIQYQAIVDNYQHTVRLIKDGTSS
jgi:hypothetical protein